MKKPAIGVIGAQGNFGIHLCRRLGNLGTVDVIRTTDKTHSKGIASRSDVVAITVRPNQVEKLLGEIRDSLKPDVVIVSFAALYPLDRISLATGRHGARVMGDPDGWACVYVMDEGFPKEKLVPILQSIHAKQPIEVRSDEEIDTYSVLLSYLLVVLLLKKEEKLPNASEHLEFLSQEFKRLGCNFSVRDLESYPLEKDARLKTFATPGGITERVMSLVQQENLSPEHIFHSTFDFVKEKKVQL